MKINYIKKEVEKAEAGDLITFEPNVIALVIEGGICLLKFSSGDDWFTSSGDDRFTLADDYLDEFKKGEYEIIAKSKDWEINILR